MWPRLTNHRDCGGSHQKTFLEVGAICSEARLPGAKDFILSGSLRIVRSKSRVMFWKPGTFDGSVMRSMLKHIHLRAYYGTSLRECLPFAVNSLSVNVNALQHWEVSRQTAQVIIHVSGTFRPVTNRKFRKFLWN